MALIIIIRHVILVVVIHAMTSYAMVSKTYKILVNSTGSRVCTVDIPSTVIPMSSSSMGGRCGVECNVTPSCLVYQFKGDLAQCELFKYQPKNFSTVDHATAYESLCACSVSALSWGFRDTTKFSGFIMAGSNMISSNDITRGFTITLLDFVSCSMSTLNTFDTYASSDQSVTLANYLNGLPMSTVLIGVTADEAINQLETTARTALNGIGVNVALLQFQGKVAFVAQIGRPALAVMKMAPPGGDNLKISVLVRGWSITSGVSFV